MDEDAEDAVEGGRTERRRGRSGRIGGCGGVFREMKMRRGWPRDRDGGGPNKRRQKINQILTYISCAPSNGAWASK